MNSIGIERSMGTMGLKVGLSGRIIIAAFSILCILTVFSSLLISYSERKNAMQAIDDQSQVLKDRLAKSLIGPIWSLDLSQVENILLVEMNDPNIKYLILWDQDGKLFTGFMHGSEGQLVRLTDSTQAKAALNADHKFYIEVIKTTNVANYRLGLVEIGHDSAALTRSINKSLIFSSMQNLTIMFVGLILLSIYFRFSVLSPLSKINAAVLKFGQKDFSARIGKETKRSNELGELSRSFNSMADIIQEYSTDLETVVRDRTSRLVKTEKLAFLGSLTAGVAHEINTPVGVSVTAASHLDEKLKLIAKQLEENSLTKSDLEGFFSEARETTLILLNNLRRASDFVSSFKKIAVDQSSEDLRLVDIGQYIEEVVFSLRPKIKKTPHTIQLEIPPNIAWYGYPGMLSQIVTNLIFNSLNHAYPDGSAGTIRIGAKLQNDFIAVYYTDDGCGIPEENLSRIFQPFFTTQREHGGTGLGLYIVSNIASKLGGTIRCESEKGKGVRFTVRLPARIEKIHEVDNERI